MAEVPADTNAPDVSISMSLHLGDVMRETAHLAPAEMGAHMRLCMAAWSRGGYLPGDPERLRRLAGADSEDWEGIWAALRELWSESGDGRLFHPRTLEEIERARAKKASYQARGRQGGRGHKKAQPNPDESSASAEGVARTKLASTAEDRSDVPVTVSSGIPEAGESSALAEAEAGGKTPPPPPPPIDPDPPKAPQGGQGGLKLSFCEGQHEPGERTEAEAIRAVFAHYRTHKSHSYRNPQLGDKEWRQIRARLKGGVTVEELCLAIDGYMRDPWSQGNNERHKKYDGLDLITRDEAHVRQGIDWARHPPRDSRSPPAQSGTLRPSRTAAPIKLGTSTGNYAAEAACDPNPPPSRKRAPPADDPDALKRDLVEHVTPPTAA